MATKLTAAAVERLRAVRERREIADAGAPGLYLTIQPSGVKSWTFRYRRPGTNKSAKLTLGRCDMSGRKPVSNPVIGTVLTLSEARSLVAQVVTARENGRDPGIDRQVEKTERKTEAQTADERTYPAFARVYIRRHAKPNTRGWRGTARDLGLDPDEDDLPVIKDSVAERWQHRPIASIAKSEIVAELDRCAADGHGRTAGNHRLAALRTMWRWHVKRGALESSPCQFIDMPVPLKLLRRTRRLSDDELRLMWRALNDLPPVFAAMVRLLVLTGVRRDEAREMVDGEVSGDEWVILGSRTKNHLDHLVPLSREASAQIDAARAARKTGKAGLVFTLDGKRAIGGMSKWKRKVGERMARTAGAPVPQWQLPAVHLRGGGPSSRRTGGT